MRGIDADGIAQTETDHFMKCPGCGEWFDMRDLDQVLARMFTTQRLRSAKVRNRRRANRRNDTVVGPAGAETKAQFNGVGRLRTYIGFKHSAF
jgi:hypothetical protein